MINPFGSLPPNATAKWVPEPTRRGTFGILSSCLITLLLCVWTAVHLNIPRDGESGIITPQAWRKFKWLIIGIFAPELIAYAAFEQLKDVSKLHEELEKILQRRSQQPSASITMRSNCLRRMIKRISKIWSLDPIRVPGRRHDWTMIHSYYAFMGGISITNLSFFNPHDHTGISLTMHGVEWVAENALDVLPNLPTQDIWDRSKANGLAKTLVCLQATWFCVQCLGRLSQGLTISVLELNTFAHALCALVTIIFWWNKPLDVESRTPLQGEHCHGVSALILVLCHLVPSKEKFDPYQLNKLVPQVQHGSQYYRTISFPVATEPARYYDTNPPYKIEFYRKSWPNRYTPVYDDPEIVASGELSGRDSATFAAANDEVRRRFQIGSLDAFDHERARRGRNSSLLSLRISNFPRGREAYYAIFGYDESGRAGSYGISAIITGLIYGGLHLTAWHAPFPFHTQLLIWRLSGIYIAAYWPVIVLYGQYSIRRSSSSLVWLIEVLRIPLFLMYAVCRVFLVVESFILLRTLPDSVLEAPAWSQYIPHIS